MKSLKLKYSIFLMVSMAFNLVGCQKKSEVKVACSEKRYIEIIDSTSVDSQSLADSRICGTLKLWGGAYPKSLNMWLDYNSFSADIMGLFYEPLVELHSETNEPVGVIAKKWEVSEDGKTFLFHLRKQAKWSDGKQITAHDFQFNYDVLMNEKNKTTLFRVGLSRFERPEVIDDLTLKIVAKEYHWKNFWEGLCYCFTF